MYINYMYPSFGILCGGSGRRSSIVIFEAVAVIDNLVDEDSALTLRSNVAQDEQDHDLLMKIQTQNKLISTRFASIMGILGKEAVEKIIRLVDETKPELMDCDIETVAEASPKSLEKTEVQNTSDISMEKGEPFIIVNEEDSQLDPLILKGKDTLEGKSGRSWVWGHFTMLSSTKVQCGICNSLLRYCNNTSTMIRHMRARHPAVCEGDTANVPVAPPQIETDGTLRQAELDAEMEMPEGRTGRSYVWDYFTLLDPYKVQCGLCQNTLSYHKSTSGMLRHIRSKHSSAIRIGTAAAQTDPEEESFQDVGMENGDACVVGNEADCQLDPVPLKAPDTLEGKGGRSWVWGHFTMLSSNEVQCGICNFVLRYSKNTSTMIRHMRARHPAVCEVDTANVPVAAPQTEADDNLGLPELDAKLEMPEGRTGRSCVWDYFTLLNPNKVQCGLCRNTLSYNQSTSGMLCHIRTRHPSVILVGAATVQTEPESSFRLAEVDVELDSPEGRGGRSWVWNHFSLSTPDKVQCRFCHKMLSYCGNTSSMLRHLRSKHPRAQQSSNHVFVGAETKSACSSERQRGTTSGEG
ncbi:hypothetical protein GJAV_G00149160 [Gymnothorax javanicus]|nr:hypothetical protein GJAV_G00149160 [Gymnothorax javanicus]